MENRGGNIIVNHSCHGSQKPDLHFDYDAMGQRIAKTVTNKNTTDGTDKFVTTYYVRDPQGNVLAVYEHKHGDSDNGTFTLAEQHLYGSGRLGMKKRDLALNVANASESTTPVTHYELTNHLGNVLAVISDEASTADEPTVVSLSDYYPYGMEMPGRSYSESDDYRYGYTGHEKVEDLADGVYITEYRLLDTRLGRWMSPDPCALRYPGLSPYNYGANIPTVMSDPNGDVIKCTSGNHELVVNSINAFISIAYSGEPIFSCQSDGTFVVNRNALYKFREWHPFSMHEQTLYYYLRPIIDVMVFCICDPRNIEFILTEEFDANTRNAYNVAAQTGGGMADIYNEIDYSNVTLDEGLHDPEYESYITIATRWRKESIVELFMHEVLGHIGGNMIDPYEHWKHTVNNNLLALAMSNNERAICGIIKGECDIRGNDGNHELYQDENKVTHTLNEIALNEESYNFPYVAYLYAHVSGYSCLNKVPYNIPLPKKSNKKNSQKRKGEEFDMRCPYNTDEKYSRSQMRRDRRKRDN